MKTLFSALQTAVQQQQDCMLGSPSSQAPVPHPAVQGQRWQSLLTVP